MSGTFLSTLTSNLLLIISATTVDCPVYAKNSDEMQPTASHPSFYFEAWLFQAFLHQRLKIIFQLRILRIQQTVLPDVEDVKEIPDGTAQPQRIYDQ